ncbi:MAG: LysR substrate-binding domain-containing protein [Burkholderiales bacterium]
MNHREVSGKSPPPFSALRAFEAVGRWGGIRRAAIALDLDHAVVSRHLRALEEWAGVGLINRQRMGRLLTAEGEIYHRRISGALDEIAHASAELLNAAGKSSLKIWCMPGLAFAWLTPALPLFRTQAPGIELELRPSAEIPDFTAYEADVSIHYIPGEAPGESDAGDESLNRQELARPPVFPVVSPELKRSLGEFHAIEDILKAPLIHEESAGQWLTWFAAYGVACPENLAGPRLWYGHVAVEAARQGQGVALANPFLVADELASASVVPLLDPARFPPVTLGSYVFIARADRWHRSEVAQFRRWLMQEMAHLMPSAKSSEVAQSVVELDPGPV